MLCAAQFLRNHACYASFLINEMKMCQYARYYYSGVAIVTAYCHIFVARFYTLRTKNRFIHEASYSLLH